MLAGIAREWLTALADYIDTGALNTRLAPSRFVADGVFATKAGDLCTILKLKGIDYECSTEETMEQITDSIVKAFKPFDEHFRIYQYVCKRNGAELIHKEDYGNKTVNRAMNRRVAELEARADSLYEIEIYMAVLYQSSTPMIGALAKFDSRKAAAHLEQAVQDDLSTLHLRIRAFCELAGHVLKIESLDSHGAYQFLRRLVNLDRTKAEAWAMVPTEDLDRAMANSSIETEYDHLRVDETYVQALSLKDLPDKTSANCLRELLALDCDFIACTEWKPLDNQKMKGLINSKRRNFSGASVSVSTLITKDQAEKKDKLQDESANEHVTDLGRTQVQIGNRRGYFGQFSCTIVLYGPELKPLKEATASVIKVFGALDASLFQEHFNLQRAYLSIIPGNYTKNLRYLYLLNSNYADLSFIWGTDTGNPRNEALRDEYLSAFETNDRQLHYFNAHIGGVMGVSMTGESGSGKSFLANQLLTDAQKYRPIVLIMDIGGSYRDITREFGGTYIHINMQHSDARINPFSLVPTEANIKFLAQFIRLLLKDDGGAPLTDKDHINIFEAVQNLCHPDMPREMRRMSHLSLPPALYRRLGRWMQGGEYGRFFDNAEDDLSLSDWQTFDFQGMEKNMEVLTPLMFYITQRFDELVYDPSLLSRLKLYVNDEGWRFLLMGEMGKYIVEKLKTGRKWNLGNLFITQSGMDLNIAGMGDVLNEACPLKLFLSNPGIKAAVYRDTYGLNEREVELVRTLIPKRQFLAHSKDGPRILNLRVDKVSELSFSTDPQSTEVKMMAAAGGR